MIEGITSDKKEEVVSSIKEILGLSKGVAPDDYIYRIACLRLGAVDPELNEEQSVRLAKAYAIVFYKLSSKIIQLTGMGMLLGE